MPSQYNLSLLHWFIGFLVALMWKQKKIFELQKLISSDVQTIFADHTALEKLLLFHRNGMPSWVTPWIVLHNPVWLRDHKVLLRIKTGYRITDIIFWKLLSFLQLTLFVYSLFFYLIGNCLVLLLKRTNFYPWLTAQISKFVHVLFWCSCEV